MGRGGARGYGDTARAQRFVPLRREFTDRRVHLAGVDKLLQAHPLTMAVEVVVGVMEMGAMVVAAVSAATAATAWP